MSLWSNTDANTSAPKYTVAGGLGVAANGFTMYNSTTAGQFAPNQTLGVFGVSANETSFASGNVESIVVSNSGSAAYGIPTVTVTGSNTVQAIATANVKVVSATVFAAGTGYESGDIMSANSGTGTTATIVVATVDANGNVQSVGVGAVGEYSAVPTANANPFTSNTSTLGTGFTANLRFGISSVTVGTVGQGYGSNVAVTTTGNGITGAVLTAPRGSEGSTKGVLSGWNLRKEGTGGRAGRVSYECLVAMGSITGDGSDDPVIKP